MAIDERPFMIKQLAAALGFAAMLCLPALALADADAPASRAAADPTIAEIYQAAESGKTGDADRMIARVLADHPDSAKAHYVHAEVLSKEGKLAAARAELDRANELAPGLPFVKSESAAELRQRIEGTAAPRRMDAPVNGNASTATFQSAPAAASSGFSPMKIGIGVLLIAALFLVFRRFAGSPVARPQAPQAPYGAGGAPYAGVPGGYTPGTGYPPGANPGAAPTGSGIGGALLTGAAAGLGAVAVEEAVRHFTQRDGSRVEYEDRRRDVAGGGFGDNLGPDTNANLGGNDFGISDAGSWDSGGGGGGDGGSDWN
jgi:uncharacterized protein